MSGAFILTENQGPLMKKKKENPDLSVGGRGRIIWLEVMGIGIT